jgi:hypothetical protein
LVDDFCLPIGWGLAVEIDVRLDDRVGIEIDCWIDCRANRDCANSDKALTQSSNNFAESEILTE